MTPRFVAAFLLLAALTLLARTSSAQAPENPDVLMQEGQSKFPRVGALAAAGQFAEAGVLMQEAMNAMDRAIELAPDRLDLRLTRGLAYGPIPSYMGKTAVARDDLERATRHPEFAGLAKDRRARAWLTLGRVYTDVAEHGKAVAALRAAVDADAESPSGKDAADRLATLVASGVKDGERFRPDRFPNVPAGTSPVVAAASITFAGDPPGRTPDWVGYVRQALDGFPGLLAAHTVTSLDHPGMVIVFTWWKDKQALNGFYYSDAHQGWMTGRGLALSGPAAAANRATQVAIEVFAGLPDGTQMNGGLMPRELFESLQRRTR